MNSVLRGPRGYSRATKVQEIPRVSRRDQGESRRDHGDPSAVKVVSKVVKGGMKGSKGMSWFKNFQEGSNNCLIGSKGGIMGVLRDPTETKVDSIGILRARGQKNLIFGGHSWQTLKILFINQLACSRAGKLGRSWAFRWFVRSKN